MTYLRIVTFVIYSLVLLNVSCIDGWGNGKKSAVQAITSIEHFNSVLESSDTHLIAFDLYADWCMPCRVLSPTLNELALEKANKISMYKVNTDKFPQIAEAFGVTGIPFVVFVKNRRALHALLGVQPKESYAQIIEQYADTTTIDTDLKKKRESIEGLQVIQFSSPLYRNTHPHVPFFPN